ncbi:MAG: ABC transporter ATP-binding protein [Hahellaceae bacterium]|nr:ABC transporter ATP-binding protein [Hahellaceae bacterium]
MLQIQGINVHYGRRQRLFDVTLPVLEDGDILGLLGPNAAGKSTLMKALSGTHAYQGNILYKGKAQGQYGPSAWAKDVAYMPQSPPQESALLPFELLWSAARALKLALTDAELRALIESLLNRLGLAEVALAPMHSLSGGKRQLVGLALALIRNPRLLLLDEPTSALDLHWRMVVLDWVRERIDHQGGIAIAALHDLDLAARYCNKLALLDRGRLVAAGPTEAVLTADVLARVFNVDVHVEKGILGHPLVQVLRPQLAPKSSLTALTSPSCSIK